MNHFPGTWGVGRKDRLCRNLARMKRDFGDHYDISATTYLLPADRAKLVREMDEDPKVGGTVADRFGSACCCRCFVFVALSSTPSRPLPPLPYLFFSVVPGISRVEPLSPMLLSMLPPICRALCAVTTSPDAVDLDSEATGIVVRPRHLTHLQGRGVDAAAREEGARRAEVHEAPAAHQRLQVRPAHLRHGDVVRPAEGVSLPQRPREVRCVRGTCYSHLPSR